LFKSRKNILISMSASFGGALVVLAVFGALSFTHAQDAAVPSPAPDVPGMPVAAQQDQVAPAATPLPAPPESSGLSINASQLTQGAPTAAAMANTTDAEKAVREQHHIKESYERAAGGLFPLSPEQIRDFMARYEKTREASQPPSSGPPKTQVRITTVSLDPGAEPPMLQLATGYVTTINIMDATGEPWPILDVGVGGNFEVTPTQAGSHVVRVMPLASYAMGNLSILLDKLPTPIVFRLSTGDADVDLRYDARIPKFGPNAKIPLINRPRLEAGNESIMMLLQNAPPKDAKRLKVSGLDARTMAWSLGDHVFVRTPLQLLSPAWDASVSSDDGMTVYEIGDAPVLLMSDNGAMVRAQITRDEEP
jgi:intracellular multiplication protein IcmK